jgi:hypothetical protein
MPGFRDCGPPGRSSRLAGPSVGQAARSVRSFAKIGDRRLASRVLLVYHRAAVAPAAVDRDAARSLDLS